MFDIGFWELALIGVVALLVVGPDRLPGLARNVGMWVGRIRRYIGSVRDDIEREIQAEELKKVLQQSDDLNPLKDIVDETRNTIGAAKKEISSVEKEAEETMSKDAMPSSTSARAASGNEIENRGEDETGAEPIKPADAATTVGNAVSTAGGASNRDSSETTVEDKRNDER